MNKYKIVSLVLSIALFVAIARLVRATQTEEPTTAEPEQTPVEIVLQNIHARKSVRRFTSQPVSREQLDILVRAAMAAPSGRDMRPWKFIVLDDREAMNNLSEQLPYAKMLTQAQAAVVICGDMTVVDKKGNPSKNWTFDCSAATENLLLAAEAMGLGAVWTGVHPYEERLAAVAKAFNLPEHIIPLNVIPIGYPKGNPKPKDKFDAGNIHYNGW